MATSSKCRPVVGSSRMSSACSVVALGEALHQLQPLRFAAGEDIERLPEREVAEPHLLQDAQRAGDLFRLELR